MKIILLKSVKSLGKEGDTVKVKDGYARNYLIPRKLAVPYAKGAIKLLEAKQKKTALEQEKKKKAAQVLAETISRLSLTIPMESGVKDTLFGSVTPETIFHALQQEGIHVDKKSITIKEPIGKLGIYSVEVTVHPDVKENLRIWVVKK